MSPARSPSRPRARPPVRFAQNAARLKTRLHRYLWNALELVELTGGGASGTKAGHGKPSAICISAPRHGSTRKDFTVKRMRYIRTVKPRSTDYSQNSNRNVRKRKRKYCTRQPDSPIFPIPPRGSRTATRPWLHHQYGTASFPTPVNPPVAIGCITKGFVFGVRGRDAVDFRPALLARDVDDKRGDASFGCDRVTPSG